MFSCLLQQYLKFQWDKNYYKMCAVEFILALIAANGVLVIALNIRYLTCYTSLFKGKNRGTSSTIGTHRNFTCSNVVIASRLFVLFVLVNEWIESSKSAISHKKIRILLFWEIKKLRREFLCVECRFANRCSTIFTH